MQLLSFDIEIADVFELGPQGDIDDHGPLHVSVAATAVHGGEERLWYSTDENDRPTANLSAARAHELLEYLDAMQAAGYMVCAWNGLGFDLKWLGHQARDPALAARVALRSFDPMFQFFNIAGFPVALAKVAQAMGIGQSKLMDGADAPKHWQAGNFQLVMDYCLGDCQMTNQVILAIDRARKVQWTTARGRLSAKPMHPLKPVEQVLLDPEPDQSWMDSPIPRARFHTWVQAALQPAG